MFRRRPPTQPPALQADLPEQDKTHGFLYWADQQALVFGADRREPRSHRLSLSLARGTDLTAVLPCTTQSNPAFFHLSPEHCLRKSRSADRDSYVCPRYETVANRHLREEGIVTQAARVRVMRWLRDREGTA